MAEGTEHKAYVINLYNFIANLVPSDCKKLIVVDNESYSSPAPIYNGVVPDVSYHNKKTMILGEAKSLKDFEKQHSIHQYKSYIDTCENFDGEAVFVLYVHWDAFLSAQTIIKRLLPSSHKAIYIILSSNGWEAKL